MYRIGLIYQSHTLQMCLPQMAPHRGVKLDKVCLGGGVRTKKFTETFSMEFSHLCNSLSKFAF